MSEWLSSINQQTANAGEVVGKREPWCTAGGTADWCSHYGNQYGGISKNWKCNYLMTQQFHSKAFIQKIP